MISGRPCVSCYHSNREVAIGRNRKGARPKLTDRLHPISLRIMAGDKVRAVQFASVVDLPEAMILATHNASGPIVFGRPGVRWLSATAEQVVGNVDEAA